MRIALLMLMSCIGGDPLPPNTATLCEKAIACDVFESTQLVACTECLEHWSKQLNEELIKLVPPTNEITCEEMAYIANTKRIGECVAEDWWK